MAELKPCPFCGGEAELWWNGIRQCHEVRCKQCFARGGYCDGMEDAIEAWNKRTEPERPKGQWVGEADGYADGELVYDVWYCCECNHCIDDGTDDPELLPNFCPNCGADMRGESNGC